MSGYKVPSGTRQGSWRITSAGGSRKKVKVVSRKVLTKKELVDPITRRAVIAIGAWWQVRCAAGRQLSSYADYKEGYDYKGQGPWKKYVSLDAMHRDFMKSEYGYEITRTVFRMCLGRITEVTSHTRFGTVRNQWGEESLRPRVRFLRFDDPQQCQRYLSDVMRKLEE